MPVGVSIGSRVIIAKPPPHNKRETLEMCMNIILHGIGSGKGGSHRSPAIITIK
jgi:hypothetical protein